MFLKEAEKNKSNGDNHIPSFVEMRQSGSFKASNSAEEKAESGSAGWRFFKVLIGLLIIGSVGFFGWKGLQLYKVYGQFKEIESTCSQLESEIKNRDFDRAGVTLESCQQRIFETEQSVEKINNSLVNVFPQVTRPLGELLKALYRVTDDFKQFNAGIKVILAGNKVNNDNGQSQAGSLSLSLIFDHLAEFVEINNRLQRDVKDLKTILAQDNFIMRYLNKKLSSKFDELDQFNSTLNKNLPYLAIWQQALGYREEKTYLLLFQNSTELRPTGGFWGSYGILKVKAGEIISFTTDDIYHLDVNLIGRPDGPVAPEPLAKYLNVKQWFFRDANWSPNYPDAANLAEYFYLLEGGTEKRLDGIIAITPSLVEDLLILVGPIQLGDLYFNRENFLDQLEYEVELGYEDRGLSSWNRKEVLHQLSQKLMDTLQNSLSFEAVRQMSEILNNSLKKKDVLLYFKDPDLQNLVLEHNWGGQLDLDHQGDYLDIIDANLASFKTDLFIERRISYRLETQVKENKDYDLIAKLEIKYLHHGDFNWRSTRYRTYTRVYLPLGSQLITASGYMGNDRSNEPGKVDVYNELNKTVFGTFISVEPQKGGSLYFEYRLPDSIKQSLERGEYQLLLQKQPGVSNKFINLDLAFPKEIKEITDFDSTQQVIQRKFLAPEFGWQRDHFLNIKF